METPKPSSDRLTGSLFLVGDPLRSVLIAGAVPQGSPGKLLYQGEMVIRYALPFLYEPEHFIPERVVDDFRRSTEGRDAISFLFERGDSFPRADVIGRRVSSGTHDEIFVKQLDLAADLVAFAFRAPDAELALGRIDVVVWLDDFEPDWSPLPHGDERASDLLRSAAVCYRVTAQDASRLRNLLIALPR